MSKERINSPKCGGRERREGEGEREITLIGRGEKCL
jgi:hypothetical protein